NDHRGQRVRVFDPSSPPPLSPSPQLPILIQIQPLPRLCPATALSSPLSSHLNPPLSPSILPRVKATNLHSRFTSILHHRHRLLEPYLVESEKLLCLGQMPVSMMPTMMVIEGRRSIWWYGERARGVCALPIRPAYASNSYVVLGFGFG
ncbi:hypothetical protein Droror1_Dr00027943, partial [Drosera rotundifolia]